MTVKRNKGSDALDPALMVSSDRQLRGQRCDSPDPSKGAGAWCRRSEGAVGSPPSHLPRFVDAVDAPQHSDPAPSSLLPPCHVVPAPEANGMQTPDTERFAVRLGLNQSLTLNTTLHGGRGGQGGQSHGQAPGGQGGPGQGPTMNNYFTLEQTKDLTSKLNSAKDAGVRASKACLQGTRVELLNRIRNWALSPSERTLLLYGAAGTGKSAIVHTIARDLHSESLALVPFFAFNHSVQNRSSAQLIPTWAKELAEVHPPYQAYLHGLRLSNLESTDLVHQQDILLLKGLASLTNCGKPVVFIIDALDECPKDEMQDLFCILEELVCEPTLPVFARFLFTYRSHGEILNTFENAPSILHINIDDQKATVEDIYKFVTKKLHKTKVQNLAGDVSKAAQKLGKH
ncbi:hypothetical protein C8R45DRAFT_1091581 [Mycena sanguinolenta]|nr:hypothetical protein C8R45DRAFT_1091581 [Mycena sanguinolenta]